LIEDRIRHARFRTRATRIAAIYIYSTKYAIHFRQAYTLQHIIGFDDAPQLISLHKHDVARARLRYTHANSLYIAFIDLGTTFQLGRTTSMSATRPNITITFNMLAIASQLF
jgi:hypothetical protein